LARAARCFKSSEKVSTAQLMLYLDAFMQQPTAAGSDSDASTMVAPDEVDEADAKLKDASGIDALPELDKLTTKPPKQPPSRKPAPENLRRVANPLPVPAPERSCPRCGSERVCFEHDGTEVVELIPAGVIVRRDEREQQRGH